MVDDEPFVRVAMASLHDWSAQGFDFRFEAGNGQQALEVLRHHPEIDIILLDLSMPVVDGIEFLKALPEVVGLRGSDGPSPAVIVLSAHDDFPSVRQAFNLGVRDYLLKTEVDGETLAAMLHKVVAERAEPRRIEEQVQELRQREVVQAQALLRCLTAEPEAGLDPGVSVDMPYPVTLWAVGITDYEGLASRLQGDELARFQDLFQRSIRQLLDRRGGGWLVSVTQDLVAVITGPGVDETLFAKELKESLERYLSVRIEIHHRSGVDGQKLRTAWDEVGRFRSSASRIVLVTKRYLRENFTRPVIPLDELAAHVGVSRNHLSWEFTRETGETITDHLARLRVEEACRLLATTTWKVYEIAEKVGYTNVEHFSRVFKKVTGTSPNRWAGDDSPKVFRDIRQ